jgi:hypothetical protein
MPGEILQIMSVCALHLGATRPSPSLNWIVFAVLLRVGYHGLLRPADICGLRCCDVSVMTTSEGGFQAVLAITNPKTRAFMGRTQFAIIKDVITIRWLQWLLVGLPPLCRIWIGTTSSFRALFRSITDELCISHLGLSPASLRAGGATALFLSGIEIARLRFMGRWKTDASLQAYIQEAVCCLVWHQLESVERSRLELLLSASLGFYNRALLGHWAQFGLRKRQWKVFLKT